MTVTAPMAVPTQAATCRSRFRVEGLGLRVEGLGSALGGIERPSHCGSRRQQFGKMALVVFEVLIISHAALRGFDHFSRDIVRF